MKNRNKVYYNPGQQDAMFVGANREYIVGSRRFGKSDGVISPRIVRNVNAMPRSAGAFVGATYQQLLTRTLPATFAALSRIGYRRNVHYYVGRKAPQSANFKTPYLDPFSYDHVIHWYNGSIQHLISQDRPGTSNSLTLDYVMGDEAKLLNYDKLKDETFPANGGTTRYFGDCPWHHGHVFCTDMPTNKAGEWILGKREEMDVALIDIIKETILEIQLTKRAIRDQQLRGIAPTTYQLRKLRENTRDLDQFRKEAVYYREYSAIENIELLGEKYIADMKRDLPPLLFQMAILTKRVRKIENGFYPALNEKIHYYDSYDNSYLDSLDYNLQKAQAIDSRQDGDLSKDVPMVIAFDANAAINSLVVSQAKDRMHRTLKSFFVKTPRKLTELCNDFADYYFYHPNKDVVFYYDSTFVHQDASRAETYAEEIERILRGRGWNVQGVHIGNPMRHDRKHTEIDKALKGQPEYLLPQFNRNNTEYLIIAMEQTGIKIDRNGYQKDKSAEKLLDSPANPDETKTHITDAWDTNWIGCQFFPCTVMSGIALSSGII